MILKRHPLVHACLVLALLWSCAEVSVKPGINQPYKDQPDPSVWATRFEVESREIYSQREEIAKAVGLKAGQIVADIGAGTGLFVPLFARAVGDSGRVIAVDIQSSFLDHIKSKATEGGWSNVSVHLGGEREVGLPKDSVDVVFICDTYHHFEYPRTTMASIHKALRPGGDLILIDFHRIPGVSRPWILDHVRASQEVFTQEIVEAGFRPIERKEFLVENYFLRFRREP